MEQQLNGPQREEALAVVRQVARLADELAAVLRARDYARLRDMMRNRHAGELAELLTELRLEDQVRGVPRHAAERRGDRLRIPRRTTRRTRCSRRWPRKTWLRC